MKVALYALTTCPYCRMTKKMLEESGIDYQLTEGDLLEGESKEQAIDEVKRISGGTSFPVVIIDDEVIVGFNKKRIKELLGA